MKYHPVGYYPPSVPHFDNAGQATNTQPTTDVNVQDKNKDPGATEKFKEISEAYDVRSISTPQH